MEALKARVQGESQRLGLKVRIDAEDAISRGVPAELIYRNPNEAKKARLKVKNPAVFGTRFGAMGREQQKLVSLDMDDIDAAEWGEGVGRLDPDGIADLIRRDLEGEDAFQRGEAFDEWAEYERRAGETAEFEGLPWWTMTRIAYRSAAVIPSPALRFRMLSGVTASSRARARVSSFVTRSRALLSTRTISRTR